MLKQQIINIIITSLGGFTKDEILFFRLFSYKIYGRNFEMAKRVSLFKST